MIERYFYIDRDKAADLLEAAQRMCPQKRGFDRRTYLLDGFAVLSTNRLKLRNVDTRDDDLAYLDELIETLKALKNRGVSVVPILGYRCDEEEGDGKGWLIEERAKGAEMYDDAALTAYYVWARKNPSAVYLSSKIDPEEHLLCRTEFLSQAPQKHYDKFISDIMAVCECDILIDFNGKSNFFYDPDVGFQLIDLDAHTDYRYGLADVRPDSRWIASLCGFVPCHLDEATKAFSHIALNGAAISSLQPEKRKKLAADNLMIFEKCKAAMKNNGISEEEINRALERLSIFGQ